MAVGAGSVVKMAQAVAEEYTTSLEDLTFNSKPHINALTMLAEEYLEHADIIVHVIEAKLEKVYRSWFTFYMFNFPTCSILHAFLNVISM